MERRLDRHWKETQARGTYARLKQVYQETAIKLAEAVYVHGDMAHADVVATLEEFRKARLFKDDAWRVLQEVMFK